MIKHFAYASFRVKLFELFVIFTALTNLQGGEKPTTKRFDAIGQVKTVDDSPIKGATIFVSTAAPRTGTIPFCPSCYIDCGKTAISNKTGKFNIEHLSPDLIFCLLVVAKGYQPQYLTGVDPASGIVLSAKLKPLELGQSPDHILRGCVVDSSDTPVVGCLVKAHGIFDQQGKGYWGALRGVDPIAITDEKGEFVITSRDSFARMDVKLSARQFADQTVTHLASGTSSPQKLVMTQGCTLLDRVINAGRPLANVSVGIVSVDRRMEHFTGHFEVGTDSEGHFAFFNLPPNLDYYVYGLMETLGPFGTIPIKKVHGSGNGETIQNGDLVVQHGYHVAGKVVLVDEEKLPQDTRLSINRIDAWDSQLVKLGADGSFDIRGVPGETVCMSLSVRGYHISAKNRSFDLLNGNGLIGRVEGDVLNMNLLLEKGEPFPPEHKANRTQAEWEAMPQNHLLRGVE